MTREKIVKELICYAYEKMEKSNSYPFCAFIVKGGEIISRGYNYRSTHFGDKTMHGEMEAMSKANKALDKKHLIILGEDYELYSTCEPCLACFDSALWASIRKFTFCVDHTDFPEYFHDHKYNIEDYEKDNPGEIEITRKVLHKEGIELFMKAKEKYGW